MTTIETPIIIVVAMVGILVVRSLSRIQSETLVGGQIVIVEDEKSNSTNGSEVIPVFAVRQREGEERGLLSAPFISRLSYSK